MESWFLLMLLTRGGESVPIRVPMTGYEQCMAEGHYAETIASQLKDVRRSELQTDGWKNSLAHVRNQCRPTLRFRGIDAPMALLPKLA